MKKIESSTKRLLVALAIVVVIILTLLIWNKFSDIKFLPEIVKNDTPINVSGFQNDKETAIGTIVFPGVDPDKIEVTKGDNSNKVQFNVPDTTGAVLSIYAQDISNRYPKAELSAKEIEKSDALNGKAKVLTATSKAGKMTVMVWQTKDGLTGVEIEKENKF